METIVLKTEKLLTAAVAASIALSGCAQKDCAQVFDPQSRAQCYANQGHSGGYIGNGAYYYGGGYHTKPAAGYDPRSPLQRFFGAFRGGGIGGFGDGGHGG